MITLMLFYIWGTDYYESGCRAASKNSNDISVCMDWKQYRQTGSKSKTGQFQMGCRSQLLYKNEINIIEKCNKISKRNLKWLKN